MPQALLDDYVRSVHYGAESFDLIWGEIDWVNSVTQPINVYSRLRSPAGQVFGSLETYLLCIEDSLREHNSHLVKLFEIKPGIETLLVGWGMLIPGRPSIQHFEVAKQLNALWMAEVTIRRMELQLLP